MVSKEVSIDNRIQAISSASVSDLDKFWIDTMQKLTQGSTTSIEDAAKQMIAIISLLQAIYFAVVSFSNLKNILILHDAKIFLFLSPIALWLISLSFAIRVFIPKRYDTNFESPSISANTFRDIVSFKARALFCSYVVLVIGFLMMLISIFVYLYAMQAPLPENPI